MCSGAGEKGVWNTFLMMGREEKAEAFFGPDAAEDYLRMGANGGLWMLERKADGRKLYAIGFR